MASALPAFTPVEESLYLTLAGRALDSRAPNPVLGDTASAEIVRQIGYDLADFPMPSSKSFDIALRTKMLDDVVRGVVARHPDAVVLDLGAGLDPRSSRIDAPHTTDWYAIDFTEVIKVRRETMPTRPNEHGIAADLTDPHWLDEVPGDRPAVIVADGLVAFLADADFSALLNRLTSHFPSGEVAFNTYPKFAVWAIKHFRGTRSIADLVRNSGFDDPRDPERWDPDLELVEEIFATRMPEVAQTPLLTRVLSRLASRSAAVSRKGTAVLRYRF
ncbi:class I SAM-dependent methyltransferase [Saccharopolyspora sp. K220]|uniref:class I SAM-dependent methyltransferase n=1 Tax=Saccharopolyspora soli TaxID=2926618 RepID=UPI001F562415|nr:class I SAM-dependent methyltransferase [Saccharopolyspora soli]MCI2418424.1 class I SAM-dependent methyltransferase [Saccharopolyspora soli]